MMVNLAFIQQLRAISAEVRDSSGKVRKHGTRLTVRTPNGTITGTVTRLFDGGGFEIRSESYTLLAATMQDVVEVLS